MRLHRSFPRPRPRADPLPHFADHHEKFVDNYGSSFAHWDWLLGTDKKYKKHRAAQKAEKEALATKKVK